MTFTSDKLKQARDSGYSDDEIWGFVSQQDNRFNQAREAGYSLDEVSGFFSQQPTEQPITQPSVGGVSIPPAPEPLKVESPKLEEGMLRKAADIPIGILAGTAGTLKSVADVFGADSPASQQFADRERFWNNLISESGKEKQKRAAEIQQAAQDKGVWEQAKAAAQAFTEAPSLMLATGAGSLAPVIATGGAAQAVGGGAAAVTGAQVGLGALMGAGSVKGGIYEQVKQKALESGKSPEEAEKIAAEAQSYGENPEQIIAGGAIGALASATGIEATAGRAISGAARKLATGAQIVGRNIAEEVITEAPQQFQQRVAQNIASQKAGFDVPTFQGAIGEATTAGIVATALGGVAGGIDAVVASSENAQKVKLAVNTQSAAQQTSEITPLTSSVVTDQAEAVGRQAATDLQTEADQRIAETPEQRVARLEQEAAAAAGIELEEEGAGPTPKKPTVPPERIKSARWFESAARNRLEELRKKDEEGREDFTTQETEEYAFLQSNPTPEQIAERYGYQVKPAEEPTVVTPTEPAAAPTPAESLLTRKSELDAEAKRLGADNIASFNSMYATRENLTEEQRNLLNQYGEYNRQVVELGWRDAAKLDDADFGRWEKIKLTTKPVSDQELTDLGKLYLAFNERGEPQKAESVLKSIQSSKRKTNNTIEGWFKSTDETLTQEEIDTINRENQEWNDSVDAMAEILGRKTPPEEISPADIAPTFTPPTVPVTPPVAPTPEAAAVIPLEEPPSTEAAQARITEREGKPAEVVETPAGTRIEAAAYKAPDGTVYFGASHLDAMAKARDAGKIDQAAIDAKQDVASRETPEFGFATDAEPFIGRSQAEVVATGSGQMLVDKPATGLLHSNEVELDAFTAPKAEPTKPVTPTPEGAVSPVEPVVTTEAAEPQPATKPLTEPRPEVTSIYEEPIPTDITARDRGRPPDGEGVGGMGIEQQAAQEEAGLVAGLVPEAVRKADQGIVDRIVKEAPVNESETFGGNAVTIKLTDPETGGYLTVVDRQDGTPASVIYFSVPKEQRRKGVGMALQARALKEFPNMQGQVSSKSAARSAYALGRRPVNQPNATLDETLALIDEYSSVNMQVPPETPNLEPLRRVARAEQAPEDIPSLVDAGLVEMYKDQPVLTEAGIAQLPEAERPRLTPKARKIQIDTGSNEVVAEAIAKGLRIGVDQVGTDVRMPAGWTLVEDIYVPPKPIEKIAPSDIETAVIPEEAGDVFANLVRRKQEVQPVVLQKPVGSQFQNPEEFRAAFDLRGQGHTRFAIRLDLMQEDGAITEDGKNLILATIWDNNTNDEFLANMEMGSARKNVKSYGYGGRTRQTVEGGIVKQKPLLELIRQTRRGGTEADKRTALTLNTFWHEYGHAGYYSLLDAKQKKTVDDAYNKTTRAGRRAFFAEGKSDAENTPWFSKYYAKNQSEWFAQSFAEYVITQKSDQKKLVPIFEQLLDKIKAVFTKLFNRKEQVNLNDVFDFILRGEAYGQKPTWQGYTMSTKPAVYGTPRGQAISSEFTKRLLAREGQQQTRISADPETQRLMERFGAAIEQASVASKVSVKWSRSKNEYGNTEYKGKYDFTLAETNVLDSISFDVEKFDDGGAAIDYVASKGGKYVNVALNTLSRQFKNFKEAEDAIRLSIADVITNNQPKKAGGPTTEVTPTPAPEAKYQQQYNRLKSHVSNIPTPDYGTTPTQRIAALEAVRNELYNRYSKQLSDAGITVQYVGQDQAGNDAGFVASSVGNTRDGRVVLTFGNLEMRSLAQTQSNGEAAKIGVAQTVEEEIIHALHVSRMLKTWDGKTDINEHLYGSARESFADIMGRIGQEPFLNTFGPMLRAYYNKESFSNEQIITFLLQNPASTYEGYTEIVRQLVELQNRGRIGETAVAKFINSVSEFLQSVVDAITNFVGLQGYRGSELSKDVEAVSRGFRAIIGEVRESRREPAPLTQQDREYLDAVDRGDMETAQRLVDEAAKRAGYTTPASHGSAADKEFTVFDTSTSPYGRVQGSYFTKNITGTWKGWLKNRRLMRVYLKFNNPATTDVLNKMGYRIIGEDARQWLESRGYDGVIDDSMDEVVAFRPEQIKSADPITRDDQGNIIPPSQRFQPTEEDIRYAKIQMPRPAGMAPEAVTTKLESLGFGRGGIVSVVNQPDASFEGRTIIRDGKVVGIELNAAALKDDAAVERVLNHEIAESANADGALNNLVAGLTPKERKEINDAITRLGYAERARTAEEAARAVELLAEGWRGRKWFERAVARIEAWANKLGYKLTRRAAEYIAARNVSEINAEFKRAYNKFINVQGEVRESRREDTIPTFSEGSPEASTLSTMAASMAKVDAASEAKPNPANKPTYKISEIASVWMDQGGDTRQLQDMIEENTLLSPANAKRVANAIAKQYDIQQSIATAFIETQTGLSVEALPEGVNLPKEVDPDRPKPVMQRLFEVFMGVKVPPKKITGSEKAFLRSQILLKIAANRAAKNAQKATADAVVETIKSMGLYGEVRPKQVAALAKRAARVIWTSEKSVEAFNDYAAKVVANANYDADLREAKDAQKRAKQLSKQKNVAMSPQRQVLDNISKVAVNRLDNPRMFADVVNYYMRAFKSTVSPDYVVMPDSELTSYLSQMESEATANQAEIDRVANERLATKYGVSVDEVTKLIEADNIIAELQRAEKREEMENLLTEKAIETQLGLSGYDTSSLRSDQKPLVEALLKVDPSKLDAKEKQKLIRIANNVIYNDQTNGAQVFVAIANGQQNARQAAQDSAMVKKNRAWIDLLPTLGSKSMEKTFRNWALELQSVSDTFRNIFGKESMGKMFRLMGLYDLDRGFTDSNNVLDKIQEQMAEFYKKNVKKYKAAARNQDGILSEGIVGFLIQRVPAKGESESIAQRRDLIKQDIANRRDSQESDRIAMADRIEKILNEIDGNTIEEILNNLKQKYRPNYDSLMYLMNDLLPQYKDFLQRFDENFNDQANNYDNPYYLPIDFINAGPTLEITPESEALFYENVSLRPKQAANTIKRVDYTKLPLDKSNKPKEIQFNLRKGTYDSLSEQINAAYTSEAWQKIFSFMKTPEAQIALGGGANRDFMVERLNRLRISRMRRGSMNNGAMAKFADSLSTISRKLGVGIALGGVYQVFKQSPDQLISAIGTTGRPDLLSESITTIGKAKSILNKFSIGRRGDASAGYKYINQMEGAQNRLERAFTESRWSEVKENASKIADVWMVALKKTDFACAAAAWMTYYRADLDKKGIKFEGWDREAQLVDTDPTRQDAASYAENMTDIYQGSSDPTKMATFAQSGKSGWENLFKAIFVPFNSFAVQQRMRIYSDARDAFTQSGEAGKAGAAGLTATVGGMLAFHTVRRLMLPVITGAGAATLYALLGVDMDEPDEEKQKEEANKLWRQFQGEVIANMLVGGAPQFVEAKLIDSINYANYMVSLQLESDDVIDDKGEIMSFDKYQKERSPLWRYRSFDNAMTLGMLDIGLGQAEKVAMQTKMLATPEEMEKYTPEEQRLLWFSALSEWMYLMRLNDADFARMVTKARKDMVSAVKDREKRIQAIRSGR